MEIEFDPDKDATNISKHGISLNRAGDMIVLTAVDDRDRFDEPRYRLYGMIDNKPHCLAAIDRDGVVRAISLRRAHEKELRRYVPKRAQ